MSSNPGDATARPKASAAAFAVSTMPASPASAVPVSKSGPSSTPGVPLSSPRPSRAHAIGTAALGVYIVSGYANDLIYRYFGTKPYLSWISGIVLLIAFLACGSTLRSLKTTSGRLGLALGIWLLAAVPFSRWPGGSWALMESYLPRTHAIIFYSGALLLSLKHCRTIVFSMLVAASAVLFSCFQFGNLDSGRLSIRDSLFLDNPNDLGLFLVFSLGFWVYPLLSKRMLVRMAAGAGALITAYFLIKTGSRGSFIAFGAVLLTGVLLTRQRLIAFALLAPIVGGLVLFAPGATRHRLVLLTDSETDTVQADDRGAVESQRSREELLRLSIQYTLENPIFGVGAGEFIDSVWSDFKKQGIHRADLATHNGYTQISSENGIAAAGMFIAIIWLTIRNSYRIYRKMRIAPHESLPRMAVAVMLSGVALAVDLTFHNIGYSAYLPILAGLAIALEMAARDIPIPVSSLTAA